LYKKIKMGQETIKLELIEWLTKLKDLDTLNYLKIVKDSRSRKQDWWNDLTEQQKLGIQRGLKDIDEGRIVSHSDVKKKYGL
jgi:hypothetical protein